MGAKTESVCAGNNVKLNSEMCLKRLQSFTFYKWNDAFSNAIYIKNVVKKWSFHTNFSAHGLGSWPRELGVLQHPPLQGRV